MEHLQPVLWHEGMFLTPQQFQQWDRAADWRVRRALRIAQPLAIGFTELDLDREAIATDQVVLRSAAGVLPDGTLFAMPEADRPPAARGFRERFTPQVERLPVYLALPARTAGQASIPDDRREPPRPLRFRRAAVTVGDEIVGGAEREIAVVERDWRLRFGDEDLDGFSSLRIAELVRSPAGGFQLAEDFTPPAITLAAAPAVVRIAKRIADIAVARAAELAQARRSRISGIVEFSASESANYLLLHTLNGAVPGLLHLLRQPGTHPERLHLALTGLAGHLHTFTSDGHAKDLPAYDHERPGASFAALEVRLRALLETSITARYTPLPLKRGGGNIFSATLPEPVLAGHRIYLSVQSSAPAEKLMQQTPLKAKIAASARVPQLVAQSIKGLALTYLPVPPAEIPAQPGNCYFELQRVGDDWEQVVETRTLGIHLPPDFTDLKLEFMAVQE
ncbi:type VI secretion protein [Planctomycetota bacterium]|nr:type VI secretion protein [Planctomycetota bacterium]